MQRNDVLARRLATQRLTGPAAPNPAAVVRELLCVQSQDAPLARAMIGYRCRAGSAAAVRAAVADGSLVRTHILRPTWHYVAADDLRWLLELSSPPADAPMNARERQLGLDQRLIDRALAVFAERLAGHRYVVRSDLGVALAEAGVLDRSDPLFGQQVGHLLLFGEYRAVICSAPVDAAAHHYALVDEVAPTTPPRSREDAVAELTRRFLTGHGPVAIKELQRWIRLTLAELRPALERLRDTLEVTVVDGVELWHGPEREPTRPQRAWLLSIFDEAFLTYPLVNFPRSAGHPAGDRPYRFAEAGSGVVICDLVNVGGWQRRAGRIDLDLDPGLDAPQRAAVDQAVDRLLTTLG